MKIVSKLQKSIKAFFTFFLLMTLHSIAFAKVDASCVRDLVGAGADGRTAARSCEVGGFVNAACVKDLVRIGLEGPLAVLDCYKGREPDISCVRDLVRADVHPWIAVLHCR